MHNSNIKYWLALYYAPNIGPVRLRQLLNHFATIEEPFKTPKNQLATLKLPATLIEYLCQPQWQQVDADLNWSTQPENHVICLDDPNYPDLLKEIYASPTILFVKGHLELLSSAQLAMVGSRNASKIGLETAYDFAYKLANAGLTVTSGLALGIDQACHNGALAANGTTIAVLGTGLNHIYPFKHQALAEKIVAQGALISEFPLATKPLAANFPQRNRIISGLSLGTLVIEASLRSGSLITARFALEQNRSIFAIPGSIHNTLVKGCHTLLKQGAKLVENIDDILEELTFIKPDTSTTTTIKPIESQSAPLAEPYRKLLECIAYEPTSVDSIIQRSSLAAAEVSAVLLLLELQGCISSCPGGYLRVK